MSNVESKESQLSKHSSSVNTNNLWTDSFSASRLRSIKRKFELGQNSPGTDFDCFDCFADTLPIIYKLLSGASYPCLV